MPSSRGPSRGLSMGSQGSPWAVTQEFTHKNKPQLANPVRTGDPATIAKQAAMELEKRLGIKPLPKLHCFTMNLAGERPDPLEIQMQKEVKEREKERRKHVRKLRHMYQLALSNKATSQRILDKQDLFHNELNSNTIEDLTENLDAMLEYNRQMEDQEEDVDENIAWMKYINQRALVPLPSPSPPPPVMQTPALPAPPQHKHPNVKHRKQQLKALPCPPAPPPPLSILAIATPKVMEAKCLSSLWTNYTKEPTDTSLLE